MRLPFDALSKGVYSLLTSRVSTPVYDAVPDSTTYPYIVIGDFSSALDETKTLVMHDVTTTIHVYSLGRGMKELVTVLESVLETLSNYEPDLSSDNFSILLGRYSLVETLREYDGEVIIRHGIIRFRWRVQDLLT